MNNTQGHYNSLLFLPKIRKVPSTPIEQKRLDITGIDLENECIILYTEEEIKELKRIIINKIKDIIGDLADIIIKYLVWCEELKITHDNIVNIFPRIIIEHKKVKIEIQRGSIKEIAIVIYGLDIQYLDFYDIFNNGRDNITLSNYNNTRFGFNIVERYLKLEKSKFYENHKYIEENIDDNIKQELEGIRNLNGYTVFGMGWGERVEFISIISNKEEMKDLMAIMYRLMYIIMDNSK